jgi:hypothetical protein
MDLRHHALALTGVGHVPPGTDMEVQPPDTTPATNAALILGANDILVYAILGPRR